MPALDPRIVRVGIEINGELRVYENLYLTASGSKFSYTLQNECEINFA
jgi:hypothetical protein